MKTLNNLKSFGLLLLTLILTSCTDQIKSISEESNLTATWSWTSSTGGIAGITNTPTSTGKNIDLIISSDNKYSVYTNGKISSQGTYTIGTQKCIHDNTVKNVIVFSNDTSMMIEQIDTINLFLSDEFYDGFSVSYVRK